MAEEHKGKKRGLGSAPKKTVRRVASEGGRAHHDQRGQKGSDNNT